MHETGSTVPLATAIPQGAPDPSPEGPSNPEDKRRDDDGNERQPLDDSAKTNDNQVSNTTAAAPRRRRRRRRRQYINVSSLHTLHTSHH